MRNIIPIFHEVTGRVSTCLDYISSLLLIHMRADQLQEALSSEVQDGPRTLDMLSWMLRGALEMIGQAGLGYPLDPLINDRRNAFSEAVKSLGLVFRTLLIAE